MFRNQNPLGRIQDFAKPGNSLKQLWITRAPGPTATGLAYKLGWLTDTFKPDGIRVEGLQESPTELRRHHYDHRLPSMIREGGNIQAFGARAQGEATKLIGLTWVDEAQAILALPGSGISSGADLKGRRLALPNWIEHPIPAHQRASSIARGMSLQGYRGALGSAGLSLEDVKLVEVDATRAARVGESEVGGGAQAGLWSFDALVEGKVDVLYVKGASAIDAARTLGLSVAINLDDLPERRFRVNNGTPRPITVHDNLLENHFDIVVRFLVQILKVSDWAADNLPQVRRLLETETRASSAAVRQAYSDHALSALHPVLDPERLALFERQKTALWVHGFLERDFDLSDWVDRRPLEAAVKILHQETEPLASS